MKSETLRMVWAAYSVGHPSIRQVATQTGLSTSTVRQARQILGDYGYLVGLRGMRTTTARIPLIGSDCWLRDYATLRHLVSQPETMVLSIQLPLSAHVELNSIGGLNIAVFHPSPALLASLRDALGPVPELDLPCDAPGHDVASCSCYVAGCEEQRDPP